MESDGMADHAPKTQASATDPIIRIRDLTFRRGKKTILEGINLDITRGQVVALMGPSGAGKTTLLQLSAGQLQPMKAPSKSTASTLRR